jgi:hypothetical protein
MIVINLHDSAGSVQRIRVNETDPIQILEQHIPLQSRQWIVFRGSVLMPGFSFRYHGLGDSEDVYVCRPSVRSETPRTSIGHMHADVRSAGDQLRGGTTRTSPRSILLELARLVDITQLDAPEWPIRDAKDEEDGQAQTTVVDPVPSSPGPSCEALPHKWFTGR